MINLTFQSAAKSFGKALGLMALLTALVVPGANAASNKRQAVKKQQVTKLTVKASASKKVITTRNSRKTMQFAAGGKRKTKPVIRVIAPPKPSFGQIAG